MFPKTFEPRFIFLTWLISRKLLARILQGLNHLARILQVLNHLARFLQDFNALIIRAYICACRSHFWVFFSLAARVFDALFVELSIATSLVVNGVTEVHAKTSALHNKKFARPLAIEPKILECCKNLGTGMHSLSRLFCKLFASLSIRRPLGSLLVFAHWLH